MIIPGYGASQALTEMPGARRWKVVKRKRKNFSVLQAVSSIDVAPMPYLEHQDFLLVIVG